VDDIPEFVLTGKDFVEVVIGLLIRFTSGNTSIKIINLDIVGCIGTNQRNGGPQLLK